MAVGYPIVNGNYFDFSSITLVVNTVKFTGIKSLNYTSEQTPGEVYGTSAQKLGRTRGQNKVTGSIEIYRPEFLDLQRALQGAALVTGTTGIGIHEANVLITVSYSEAPPVGVPGGVAAEVQTDSLIGVRFNKVDQSHSSGSDALTVKMDFDAMYLLLNNSIPLNQLIKMSGAVS